MKTKSSPSALDARPSTSFSRLSTFRVASLAPGCRTVLHGSARWASLWAGFLHASRRFGCLALRAAICRLPGQRPLARVQLFTFSSFFLLRHSTLNFLLRPRRSTLAAALAPLAREVRNHFTGLLAFRATANRPAGPLARAVAFAVVALMSIGNNAWAADATWLGGTSGAWNNNANWSAAFPNLSSDDATFNADTPNSVITLGADITIGSIIFDTANCEAYTINSGNKFILAGSGSITVNSAVTTTQTINTILQLGGNGGAATYNLVNNSTTAGQSLTYGGGITGGSGGTAGAKVLAVSGAGNINLGGIISNGGATNVSLTKSGNGILTLSNVNTYTGTTSISAGTLTVGSGGVINNANTAGGTGSISGGTLRIDGGTAKFNTAASGDTGLQVGTTTAGNVVVTNSGTLAISTGRLILGGSGAGSGTSTFTQDSGVTTVASNLYTANFNATDINISGGSFTVSGSSVISQRANTNFNISGTASVNFGAAVTLGGQAGTYTPIFNLNGGTLSVVNIADSANGTSAVNFNGGKLQARADNADFLNADAVTISNSGGTIDTQGFNVTIDNALQRLSGATTDALTKIGGGALTITGASTYGGGTNIQNGSIIFGGGNDRLLTTGSVTLGAASTSGKLVLGDGTARNQTLAGLTTTGLGGSVVGGAATNGTLTLNIAGTSEFAGTLGGGGTNENNLAFAKSGAGKLTLSGTNTFVGNVSLGTSSGTLRITNSSALGTGTKTVTNNSASSGSPGQANLLELDSNGGADISLASSISFQTSGINGVILNTAGNNVLNGTISMTVGNGNTKIISNGGTLKLAGNISAAAADRVLDLAGTSLGNNEFSGVLSNGSTPALLKSGAGKWILSGANTFQGTTTITGGTLALTNNLALQFSALNTDFTGGGTLDLTGVNTPTIGAFTGAGNMVLPANVTSLTLNPQSGSASYSGSISGGTGLVLVKSGAGTQVLSNSNSYSGATSISAGILSITTANALGNTSAVAITSTVVAGGVLELGNGVTVTGKSLTISGYGTGVRGALRAASGATAEWAGPVTIGGMGSPADNRVGAMAGGTLTISGKISDGTQNIFMVSADATVGNAGKVIVSGANDYTGQTQIMRGTLALGANDSLPTGTVLNVHAGSSVTDPAVFDLNGYNQQVAGLYRGATNGGVTGTATVTNSGGTTKTLTINNTSDYIYDSAITGNLALVKAGEAKQTLSGTNTYNGGTRIDNGTLALGSVDALGSTGTISMNGGTLQFSASNTSDYTTGSRLKIEDAKIATFDTNGQAVTFANALALGTGSTGGLTLNDTAAIKGSLTLSGTNTFTGGTRIDGGTLTLGHATNTLADTGAINVNGGVLALGTNTDSVGAVTLTSGSITGSGAGTLTGSSYDVQSGSVSATLGGVAVALSKSTGGTVTLTGANTYSGGTTITGGTINVDNASALGDSTGALTFNGSGATLQLGATIASTTRNYVLTSAGTIDTNGYNLTSSGTISGAGGLTKAGTGTLLVSGTNTYSGDTTISNGTLQVGSATAIPSGAGKGNVVMNGGAGFAGILDLNGNDLSINGLSGTNSTQYGQVVNNTSSTSKTLTLGNNDATATFAGVIANNTGTGGTLALTKTGSGTQTLTGTNTYSGVTTVSGGSLVVSNGTNGSLGSTSQVVVTTGGSFLVGANEVVNNSATVSLQGGTLGFAGTATSATETIGALTLTTGSTLDFGINGTTFKFSGFTPDGYSLAVNNWTYNSNHLVFTADQTSNLSKFTFSNGFAATQVPVTGGFEIIAIPEPGTVAAGLLLLGGLFFFERKRLRRLFAAEKAES